jgi:hypothetical protein
VSPALDPAQAPVLAEITGLSVDTTGVVETVKPALFWPAGTITCEGTLAELEELERFTAWPPAGAGVVSATFPLTLFPPITSDLESVTFPTHAALAAGFTVSVADAVFAEVAVMLAAVEEETAEVVTENAPLLCPAGIVMDAGTVAAGLLLDKPTCTPPAGAAEASVTVPVALWPPDTEDGEIDKLASVPDATDGALGAGFTVSGAETVVAEDAVIVAAVGKETAVVDIGNVAAVCPEGTVIDSGTRAAELLLDKLTCAPPAGAPEASVTVPVAL